MEGYHGTVFAYGMTGTGKTFSMQGTAQSPGVIPLAITDIFSYIREHPNREFLLRVSYLEIYNERIYDLLNSERDGAAGVQQEEIKLREDSKRGVYATPLKEEIVQSPTQLLRVIARGDLVRRTGSTAFNLRSSRSHAVVQIVVESRERAGAQPGADSDQLPGGVLVSTLSLIDLAGSERAADNKERRTEGAHINKSLLTLGTIISRLSGTKDDKGDVKEKDRRHLPYRDSKLTRLLQPALSGNALVSILCTIHLASPTNTAAAHTSETLNTLNFASRAKNNIVSHAKRNESHPGHAGGAAALLDRYRLEIEDLRRQLEEQNRAKDEAERQEEEEERWRERERESAERHEEQMLEMQLARTALKERIGHLNRLILSSKSIGVNAGRPSGVGVRAQATVTADTVGVALSSPDIAHSSTVKFGAAAAPSAKRAISYNSAKSDILSPINPSQLVELEGDTPQDDETISASSIDGSATLDQQVRALQADLADKNRYISRLENRLLQVRRSSHGNASATDSPAVKSTGQDRVLLDKDREIEDLRARLDDQTRMVNALRSAARTRDLLASERRVSSNSITNGVRSSSVPVGAMPPVPPLPPPSPPPSKPGVSGKTKKARRVAGRVASQRSLASVSSSGSRGRQSVNFSRLTLGGGVLSTSRSEPALLVRDDTVEADVIGFGRSVLRRQESVEEMTLLLDEMIRQKIESGHAVDGLMGRREALLQD